MGDKQSDRFQVHVSKGGRNRGSKIATVLFFVVATALGAGVYYFWSMQDQLVQHIIDRDGLAVPAAWALHLKGEPPEAVYQPLRAALEQGPPSLRRPAALALGHFQRRELVAPVLDVLATDSDPQVRAAAATCLGINGDTSNPLLENGLREALGDPHSDVRAATALAVGRLQYGSLIPELIGLLGNHENSVKKAARDALETFTEGDVTFDFNRRQWQEWYSEQY